MSWRKRKPAPAPSPTPTPTPVSTNPSGQSLPVGDLPGWKYVYGEDFNTDVPVGGFAANGTPPAAYPAIQNYQSGWPDTAHVGQRAPEKVLSVHNSLLDYRLHTENGIALTAVPWITSTKGHTYGRYAMRFKSDNLPGYAIAALLWPDSEIWPGDGEIDFPETALSSGYTINAFAHHANPAGGQDVFHTLGYPSDWHTTVIEWTPGKIQFFLDGNLIGTSTTDVPSKPMHWVLQTDTAYGVNPDPAEDGHLLIDWIAFWTQV